MCLDIDCTKGDNMEQYALTAEKVCRAYGANKVLDDFSLSLEKGEFAAIMGPSGIGKSTFLHIASGLVAADSGKVIVGGKDIVAMKDAEAAVFRRRHIGIVFQQFNLLPNKTVRENILYPLNLDGRKPAPEQMREIVETLAIDRILDKKPDFISGGEQQRAAIARALMIGAELILADEPTGNLDLKSSRDTCRMLKEIGQKRKAAILMVTHDPVVAANADKVHFLRDGKIVSSFETKGDPALVSKLYLEAYK